MKVYTGWGLSYVSALEGKQPQTLTLPVPDRKYYRANVPNEMDGLLASISTPIRLD